LTEQECVVAARSWDAAALQRVLSDLKRGATQKGWAPGKDFEYLMVRAFEVEGVDVTYPFRVAVHDGNRTTEQIDGAIVHRDMLFLLESKAWEKPVSRGPLALLTSQLARRPPATMGMVFTLKGYTDAAVALTNMTSPVRVLLWTPDEVELAISQSKLKRALDFKYRYAQEHGMADGTWHPEVTS
jgi:Restriction endonuclease